MSGRAIAACSALVFVLAACSSGSVGTGRSATNVESSSGSRSSGGTVTLDLMVAAYSDSTKAEWQQIIKDFESTNSDIKINLEVESWDDIHNVITTRVQAGNPPDILNIDTFVEFSRAGLLYPVQDVASQKLIDSFEKPFVKSSSVDGTFWAMPFIASSRAMFYNKDIFKKAGVAEPPKTWAELEDAAKKIKAAGSIPYGMPLGAEEAQGEAAYWFYGAGGGYGDAEKLTINTPQNVEGATEMQKLVNEKLTEPGAAATNRDPLLDVFTQGQIGMIVGLPQTVVQIQKKNPSLSYGIAPIATKDGSLFTLGVADHIMAFKSKVDKTAAMKKFFDYFFLSGTVYTDWLKAEGFLPTTEPAAKSMADNKDLAEFLKVLPDAVFYPATNPKWQVAQSALQSQLGQIAQGQDPEKVLAAIQAKVDGK